MPLVTLDFLPKNFKKYQIIERESKGEVGILFVPQIGSLSSTQLFKRPNAPINNPISLILCRNPWQLNQTMP